MCKKYTLELGDEIYEYKRMELCVLKENMKIIRIFLEKYCSVAKPCLPQIKLSENSRHWSVKTPN